MTDDTPGLPEFRDWSVAAVRLLQGAVYQDDGSNWDVVLANRSTLETYFGRLGLRLVVDETDGLAYLRQLAGDDLPEGYEKLPKLFRRSRLSYDATLLCVLLRDELRRFEDEDLHNERCVIQTADLFAQWKALHPPHEDEVRLRKSLDAALKTLEGLKFVRPLGGDPPEWEIRRILKARLSAAELQSLKEQLLSAASRRNGKGRGTDADD